jgi:hypothetical protein
MTEYRVTDASEREVKSGDIVFDCRGDAARFECVSRGASFGKYARVIVGGTERYAAAFNLTVEEL